jgi:hypothetical protein
MNVPTIRTFGEYLARYEKLGETISCFLQAADLSCDRTKSQGKREGLRWPNKCRQILAVLRVTAPQTMYDSGYRRISYHCIIEKLRDQAGLNGVTVSTIVGLFSEHNLLWLPRGPITSKLYPETWSHTIWDGYLMTDREKNEGNTLYR